MKYKVGDRVRVRRDLVEDEVPYYMEGSYSNSMIAVGGMVELGGTVVTISAIEENWNKMPQYRIAEYQCFWTDEMFEGLVFEGLVEEAPEEAAWDWQQLF